MVPVVSIGSVDAAVVVSVVSRGVCVGRLGETGGASVGCVGGLVVTGGSFVGGFWVRMRCFVLSVVPAVSCGGTRALSVVSAVSCGAIVRCQWRLRFHMGPNARWQWCLWFHPGADGRCQWCQWFQPGVWTLRWWCQWFRGECVLVGWVKPVALLLVVLVGCL